MNIFLIQPPKQLSFDSIISYDWSQCRPLSLIYLSAAIKKYSLHTSNIIDFESPEFNSLESIHNKIKTLNGAVFGITGTTMTRLSTIYIANLIKKMHPDSYVIVGGAHFSNCADETLQDVQSIDFVLRGEGELSIIRLLDTIDQKNDLNNIKGLTYRKGNEIVSNSDNDVFENIDELDIKDSAYVSNYPEMLMGVEEEIPAISIMSSRGCPNHCVFCSKSGLKYRHHSVDTVINEIKYYIEHFNIKAFNFVDLTFTANIKESEKLCERIITEKLNIKWWCETRANIPLSLLDLMKDAGCMSLVVGVESGSPAVVKRLKKGITLSDVDAVIKKCYELKIICQTYFMYSHPQESYEEGLDTLKLIKKIKKKYNINSAFQPTLILPGTEIEKIAKKNNLYPDFRWSSEYYCSFNSKLYQLSNIPLFIDRMTHQELLILSKKFKKMLTLNNIFDTINRKGLTNYIFYYIDRLRKVYKEKGIKGLILKISNNLKLIFLGPTSH